MKIVAFAWASGLIGFGNECPDGALPIIVGEKKAVTDTVSVLARHSRTSDDLLVPGIPEAVNQDEALKALVKFTKYVKQSVNKEKIKW